MSKQAIKALDKKQKMQERIKEMEAEIKDLNDKAEQEIGKYILKKWNVGNDTGKVFEAIDALTDQANELLKDDDDMGKYEEEKEHQTH